MEINTQAKGSKTNLRVKSKLSMSELTGKIPPQSVDLEKAVLGAILLERDAMNLVADILNPEQFYLEKHSIMYKAMENIFNRNPPEPIDFHTVREELKAGGSLELIGGVPYLIEITKSVKAGGNLEAYARKLNEYAIKRELLEVSYEMQRQGYDDGTDAFEVLDDVQQDLMEISEKSLRRSYASIEDIVRDAVDELKLKKDQPDGLTGVPSGFTDLDKITNGWQKASLNILAARPAMGKTALALSIVRNTALQFKKGVAFFSLEMPRIQIMNRLFSMDTEVDSEKIQNGKLSESDWQRLYESSARYEKAPVFIDDSPSLSVPELRVKCRRLYSQYGISLIVIDYLQQMHASHNSKSNMNREQEISTISRGLKQLAMELNIPVLALAQLSRQVETRQEKRPQLSDLRESGAIEQDADLVMFIYRASYYEKNEDPSVPTDASEVLVEKNRHGARGKVDLIFKQQFTKFTDKDEFPSNLTPLSKLQGQAAIPPSFGGGTITLGSKINNRNTTPPPSEEEDAPF